MSVARYLFTDPRWGPVAFTLSVWRDERNDLPEYQVVVE